MKTKIKTDAAYLDVIAGYHVPVINVTGPASALVGRRLAEGHPFAACYRDTAEGREFTLYSDMNGLDVNVIAQRFKGGGEANRAMFRIPKPNSYIDYFIKEVL